VAVAIRPELDKLTETIHQSSHPAFLDLDMPKLASPPFMVAEHARFRFTGNLGSCPSQARRSAEMGNSKFEMSFNCFYERVWEQLRVYENESNAVLQAVSAISPFFGSAKTATPFECTWWSLSMVMDRRESGFYNSRVIANPIGFDGV